MWTSLRCLLLWGKKCCPLTCLCWAAAYSFGWLSFCHVGIQKVTLHVLSSLHLSLSLRKENYAAIPDRRRHGQDLFLHLYVERNTISLLFYFLRNPINLQKCVKFKVHFQKRFGIREICNSDVNELYELIKVRLLYVVWTYLGVESGDIVSCSFLFFIWRILEL